MGRFIIAKKIKSKWHGLMSCSGSCLANAADTFAAHGLNYWTMPLKIYWLEDFESQKNYAGRVSDFVELN